MLYQGTIKGIRSHLCWMNRIATRILDFTPSDCSRMAVSFNNSSPANMSGGSSLSCGTLSFHVSCNMFALEWLSRARGVFKIFCLCSSKSGIFKFHMKSLQPALPCSVRLTEHRRENAVMLSQERKPSRLWIGNYDCPSDVDASNFNQDGSWGSREVDRHFCWRQNRFSQYVLYWTLAVAGASTAGESLTLW